MDSEFTHITLELEFNIPGSPPEDDSLIPRIERGIERGIEEEFGPNADAIIARVT